jgi:hypothetical protein
MAALESSPPMRKRTHSSRDAPERPINVMPHPGYVMEPPAYMIVPPSHGMHFVESALHLPEADATALRAALAPRQAEPPHDIVSLPFGGFAGGQPRMFVSVRKEDEAKRCAALAAGRSR